MKKKRTKKNMWQRPDVTHKHKMFTLSPFPEKDCWPLISVVIPSIERICSFVFLYLYKERKSNKYFMPLLPRRLLKFVNPGDHHISSSLGLSLVTVNCLPTWYWLIKLSYDETCLTSELQSYGEWESAAITGFSSSLVMYFFHKLFKKP